MRSRYSNHLYEAGAAVDCGREAVPSVDGHAVDFEDRRFEATDEVVRHAPRIRGRVRPDPNLLTAARYRAAPLEVGDVRAGLAIEPRADADLAALARLDDDHVRAHLVDRHDPVESREVVPIDGRP